MAMIAYTTAVGAGATVQNAWAGDVFEFLRADSTIKLGLVSDVVGVVATWKIGDGIVVENAPVTLAAAGVGPTADADMKYVDAGRAGQRLTLTLTATGAAAAVQSLAIIA